MTSVLEQFQEKWKPVLRPELRKNKEIEHFRDSEKSGKALKEVTTMAEKVLDDDVRRLAEKTD